MAGLVSEVREDLRKDVGPGSAPDVSIVIVTYNSVETVGECLTSIRDTHTECGIETIVVDNHSTDGTADHLADRFSWTRLIRNRSNVGYSRGVNQGIAASGGRYILVLNPDIVVLEGAIDRLVAYMDAHPDGGIAGAKLLNSDGTTQHSCRRFYTFWTLLLRRTFLGKVLRRSSTIPRYLMLDYDHVEPRAVDWIIGACMMVRRSATDDVGLMDERFFLYFEDVDWCYRMWRGGWRVYYVADAVMRHRYARESARPGISRQLVAHMMSLFHFYEKWGRVIYIVKKFRRLILISMLVFSDLVAVNGSFALAYFLRSSLRGFLAKPMFGFGVYGTFLVFANLVLLLSMAFFGLYDERREREPGSETALRVFRATFVSAVVLMASTFLAYQTVYSRVLVAVFCALFVVTATLLRMLQRSLHRAVRAGRFDLTRAVIVGTDDTASRLAERLVSDAELGYDLAGLVSSGNGEPKRTGFPVIGSLEELPDLIERQRIGEVIFADPSLPKEKLADFLLSARRSAIDVKMVSGLTGILTQRARVEEFLDLPVLSFEREALLRAGAGLKRFFDIISAVALLAVWSPALVVTLAIGGLRRRMPFETLRAAGRDARPFEMITLAESRSPSALRRFVLRHGLDRFPAIVNVFRGEMSFVGPEPVTPESVASCDERGMLRFDARPGLTGLAQVAGRSLSAAADDPTALDAYYVQNWSLGGDLEIILRWITRCILGRCGETPLRRSAPAAAADTASQEG